MSKFGGLGTFVQLRQGHKIELATPTDIGWVLQHLVI